MMNIQLVAPRSISAAEMAANTVYLDGAVAGTVLSPTANSWSFDHHGEGVRFAQRCAAAQLFSALVQGLDLSGIGEVMVSSIDADSVCATWIATRTPEELSALRGDLRFQSFIDKLDRVDSHGPAALLVGEAALAASFKLTANKRAGEEESTELLLAKVEEFQRLYAAGTYDATAAMPPRKGVAVALSATGKIISRVEGDVGFHSIYGSGGNFGVVAAEGSYTIGKLPFAAVPSFKEGLFASLNILETNGAWGGADSIGGSPMGKASSLSEEAVLLAIQQWIASK